MIWSLERNEIASDLIFSYVEQLEGKIMFKKLVGCCAGFHSTPPCMSVSSCALVMRGLSQLMSSNFYVAYITCPVIGVKIPRSRLRIQLLIEELR